MKLIFGLGNVGREYAGTRHNAGFNVLDALAESHASSFSCKTKFKADLAEVIADGEKVLLAKPITFYNNVGESYRSLIDFYDLESADTLVVHDELALPFGTIRARIGGTDAGNNGIKSINQHGGGSSKRLRIGIANETRQLIGDTDFVLGRFGADESKLFTNELTPRATELINMFLNGEYEAVSHTVL